jgi:hypothetical protein
MTALENKTANGKPCSEAVGRFDLAVHQPEVSGMRAALMTGLLVLFPTFATVAAVVVGLMLTGGNSA